MDEIDHPRDQLNQIAETLEEWQIRLVLSFVKNLFGSEPQKEESIEPAQK
jgi:hypothetical protein